MKKVAIVGLAPTEELLPFGDGEWETWGLLFDPENWCRFHRVFEMHLPEVWERFGISNYVDRMTDAPGIVYTQETYPLDDVTDAIGLDYYVCSVSYMLALAIYQRAPEIKLIGIEALDYPEQRPNLEYLLGVAHGRGIKTEWSSAAAFGTYDHHPQYPVRYGYA